MCWVPSTYQLCYIRFSFNPHKQQVLHYVCGKLTEVKQLLSEKVLTRFLDIKAFAYLGFSNL